MVSGIIASMFRVSSSSPAPAAFSVFTFSGFASFCVPVSDEQVMTIIAGERGEERVVMQD